MSADIVVVGGGIAGLSVGALLARAGAQVLVLEQGSAPFTHASGRNAAIFRHAEPTELLCRLAARSRLLYATHCGTDWMRPSGAFYLARSPGALDAIAGAMARAAIPATALSGDALRARLPASWGETDVTHGLYSPLDGVLRLAVIRDAWTRTLLDSGGGLRLDSEVATLERDGRRVVGVQLRSGARISCDWVVLAGGAYAASLAAGAGLPLPLEAVRRHMFVLDAGVAAESPWPVFWRLEDEIYLRGDERLGCVASPCDEEPSAPCQPEVSPAAWPSLVDKLQTLGRGLPVNGVKEAWACLRTRAADRAPVVGCDPRVEGLAWLAALAGWGMSVGPACAEWLCRALSEGAAVPAPLSPRRFLSPSG